MIRVGGKSHPTLQDAAEHFHVSTRTVRGWIDTGVLPEPPTVEWGTRTIEVFPADYLSKADRALTKRRAEKRRAHDTGGK